MTSKFDSSRRKSGWSPATFWGVFALAVVTVFAQSVLAQATAGSTRAASKQPAPKAQPVATQPAPVASTAETGVKAPCDPAPDAPTTQPTQPLATSVQGDDLITKRALDIDSSVLMREQDKRMVDHFLLAVAVFFAVIAFLLFVSLPPRQPGEN